MGKETLGRWSGKVCKRVVFLFLEPRLRTIKHRGTAAGKAEQPRHECDSLKRVPAREGKKTTIAMSNGERI